MANQFRYIIVGGGAAGASAIEGIRLHDRDGLIALISKENVVPYYRPALSKGLWLGKSTLASIPLYDEAHYRSLGVHLLLDTTILEFNPRGKQITDKAGGHYTYDKLLLATGGSPRVLSFGQETVHYYRTLEDYRFLRDAVDVYEEVAILGGGFIGAELAAALAANNKKVTLVFPEQHLLPKVLPSDVAAFVTEYYSTKGVNVVAGDVPVAVRRERGVITVVTKSGRKLEAGVVIGAIGINLHTEMARHAGLKIENGIAVNSYLQTSDPNIFAAGDVAHFPSAPLQKTMRIEHWNNAEAQGKRAGENMAGGNTPYEYLPFFWSDLFDLGFEAVGDIDSRLMTFADWKEKFREGVVYYLNAGRVAGVLLWNVWDRVDAARELIAGRKTFRTLQALKGRL
jgi:3-phenylpropionate/trans-cinnamate dioxygenase ferredoxin reductase subunit